MQDLSEQTEQEERPVKARRIADEFKGERPVDARRIADEFNCAVSSVYRMASRRVIPSIAVGPCGGGRRFYSSQVRTALEQLSFNKKNGTNNGSAGENGKARNDVA